MTNPYASPTADVVEDTHGSIAALPRFSSWFVVLLSIVTLGIYMVYWMYSRAGKVNTVVENKIPMAFIHAYLLMTIASWLLSIAVVVNIGINPATSGIMNSLLSLASVIVYYMAIYKMRNRICDEILQTERWSGLLTFLFSVLYLNYKINEAHDKT